MTARDLRNAMALSKAAGHTKVPVPIRVLSRMLGTRQSRKLSPPAAKQEARAPTHRESVKPT